MARNTTITISGAMPIDARKAIIKRIDEIEKQYENNPNSVTDVTAVPAVVTGATPYQIHVFTFTSVKATGTYTAVYVESAPNNETAPSLNP